MSKSTLGVVVSFLLNVATWVAPVPEHHRKTIFICTMILLVLACVWWLFAHKEELHARSNGIFTNKASGSNIASAGRDVHQHIYQSPSETKTESPLLADFSYDGKGSAIAFKFVIEPESNKPFARVDLQLHFVNKGDGAAHNVGANVYGCWIHDKPPTAMQIDRVEPSASRIRPGEARSLILTFFRKAGTTGKDGGPGFLTLDKHRDVFVMLFEITFAGTASGSATCKNEPIWLTWTPELPKGLTDTRQSEVQIARMAIDAVKQPS